MTSQNSSDSSGEHSSRIIDSSILPSLTDLDTSNPVSRDSEVLQTTHHDSTTIGSK